MADRDRNASSRVAIPIGSNTSSSSAHGIKQRSRPAFEKRHRANGGGVHDEASDSENQSDDDRNQKRHGRLETILTYGDDYDLSDKDSSSKRHKSHHGHRSRHHDDGNDDDRRRKRRSEDRSPSRRDRGKGDRRARSPEQKADEKEEDKKQPVKWGLTINMKGAKGGSRDRDTDYKTNSRGQSEGDRSSPEDSKNNKSATKKSMDEEALDALMGTTAVPKKRKLDNLDPAAADREPQAEDYQAVPIDDFGASLLRGLGWDGKMRGKVREVKRHANLTGLGAKDVKGNEDLGAWNPKGVAKKDSRPVRLNDYRKEEDKKRQRLDDRRGDNSYRRELERDRQRDRGQDK